MDLMNQKIPELIFKKLSNTISEEEDKTLTYWIKLSSENEAIYKEAIDEDKLKESLYKYFQYDINLAWGKIENRITSQNLRLRVISKKLLKYAAIVMLPLLISTYLIYKYHASNQNKDIYFSLNDATFKPGIKTATLTLANGSQIMLGRDKTAQKIKVSEYTDAIDTNYSLVYANIENADKINSYNTLETPKGGEYHLILPDGTKVWLNASSKIVYPEVFTESTRQVKVEGEVYFEVAHVSSKPFIVSTSVYDITVLGTSFNVMAYTDESCLATTLVKGKVKISTTDKNSTLYIAPGQQAFFDYHNKAITAKNVNVAQYVSWKDGLFVFKSEPLESIMKKLSRWYKCEFHFQDDKLKDFSFTGSLNKYQNLAGLLDKISETCSINFTVSAKNIVLVKNK